MSGKKNKIYDLFQNDDKDRKLTHYHRTDKQADNYSEHPEKPLTWREISECKLVQAL